jgi:hypothetical protein
VGDGPVRSTGRSGPRSRMVHGSVRDGSTWSSFGWRENRSTVGPDQDKAQDGHGFVHCLIRSGPRSRVGPGRIRLANPLQYFNTNILSTLDYAILFDLSNLLLTSFPPYMTILGLWNDNKHKLVVEFYNL